MRIIRFFLCYVLVNIFLLLVGTFLAQNVHIESLTFFGLHVQTNFVWILLGAASFGFLVASLLIMPGRVVVSLRAWELDREAGDLEKRVTLLEEQREDLIVRHEVLVQEREHALGRYHRLMSDYNKVLVERDSLRLEVVRPKAPSARPTAPTSRPTAPTSRPRAATVGPEPALAEPESGPGEPEIPGTESGVLSGPAQLVEQLAFPQRLQRLQRLLPTLPGSAVID
jgi:hypothetical protein